MAKDTRPNLLVYRFTQALAWILSVFVFGRIVRRNEIRNRKGPFIVVGNHECALDFVNLIGLCSRPMRFVISYCIFNTLPVRKLAALLGVIPKQQFQTKPSDLRRMKRILDNGDPIVIYPAGLMCEDGLSTPIPTATYKFLKWLDVDVYAARTTGAYMVMPKWAKGMRRGKTYMDVYKILDKEELAAMSESQIRARVDEALLFDAYREEDDGNILSNGNREIAGLENVLYMCPECGSECSTETEHDIIRCRVCGFTERSDRKAVLAKLEGPGNELRYVSDWSRMIREKTRSQILDGTLSELEGNTVIQLLDLKHRKFVDAGKGLLHLSRGEFRFTGTLDGEDVEMKIPIENIPTLPFKPGHHIEIQQGDTIYRCVMEDRQMMMKYVNMVELFYELDHTAV